MLTFEQIKELIELVCERGLQGIEIERSGFRVKIDGKPMTASSSAPAGLATAPAVQVSAVAPAVRQIESIEEQTVPQGSLEDEPVATDGLHLLRSPIVGTFYTSPSPDADPYVKVGDRVKKGQVLCIVEAMKLMNEIEADVNGVVVSIFPKNAQPVEFGEPLIAVNAD